MNEYCEWFFNLEEKYPSPSKAGEGEVQSKYKFGYWSDFLAIAPGVNLPDEMNYTCTIHRGFKK